MIFEPLSLEILGSIRESVGSMPNLDWFVPTSAIHVLQAQSTKR